MRGLLRGDALTLLPTLGDCSIDAIVTDPPYELGFMGKSWDNSGIAYNVDLWRECLRVLKPGGHLLAFGGSRTYHRLACAVEDAGFEIRDQIMWVYGSGFPKSLDVSKAIDKATGTLTVVGDAQRWQGWGTALKPAHEPIVVARKPLVGTVAQNVLAHGTGAINIDGCRVAGDDGDGGRWPANLIHDGSDEVLAAFPETKSGSRAEGVRKGMGFHGADGDGGPAITGDEGSAARFFYCAKADRAEREQGLAWADSVRHSDGQSDEGVGGDNPRNRTNEARKNFHPTVKPLSLMRYLLKLVTPPNGTVLDPFLGSGTTAVAAIMEGFDWIGCEMTEDYWPIIEGRVAWAREATPPSLFDEIEESA